MPLSENVPTPILIPGAYERNTLTHRQAGSMCGPAFGSPDAPPGDSTMSAATVLDRELEGGGGVSQRPRRTGTAALGSRSVVAEGAWKPSSSTGVHSWFPRWWRHAQS